MFTIRNDFHNSFANTVGGRLSERQEKRIKAKLCGISGCTCGGTLGERGPQDCDIVDDSDGRVIVGEKPARDAWDDIVEEVVAESWRCH